MLPGVSEDVTRQDGVLAGLGSFRRKESIPMFVNALAEGDVRLTAEAMLRTFGATARPALTAAALDHGQDDRSESETHLRERRSALALLLDIGIPRRSWPHIRPLMDDDDLQIPLLACQACIQVGATKDRALITSRLTDLKRKADWFDKEGSKHCSIFSAAPRRQTQNLDSGRADVLTTQQRRHFRDASVARRASTCFQLALMVSNPC
jgi:hypothetical protein